MNCKPGDLALWVTRGALVEVIELTHDGDIETSVSGRRVRIINDSPDPAWRIRILGGPQSSNSLPGLAFREMSVFDKSLRPLRDNDGEDEILRIAGKPRKTQHEALLEAVKAKCAADKERRTA